MSGKIKKSYLPPLKTKVENVLLNDHDFRVNPSQKVVASPLLTYNIATLCHHNGVKILPEGADKMEQY